MVTQRQNQTELKPFGETVQRIKTRVLEMQPVDRWSNIQRFEFSPIIKDRVQLIPFPSENQLATQDIFPPLNLNKLALEQLLEKVGYPVKLLQRLPEKLNHLAVNWLIQNAMDGDKQSLLRTVHGNEVRAILSARYTPLDDMELISIATPYLENASVCWEAFGETSTHISVIWPETTGETGMIRGLHMANSEVGMRSVTIEAILYRPACGNILPANYGGDGNYDAYKIKNPLSATPGARVSGGALRGEQKSGWRFIHTGDRDRLNSFVKDAIGDARMSADSLLLRYNQALTKEIDCIGAIENLSRDAKLSHEQFKAALEAWATEPMGNTVAGVANAFTRAAQLEDNPDDRHMMQGMGTKALVRL